MLASRLPVSKDNTAVGRRMVTAFTGVLLLGLLALWLFALRALGVPGSVTLVLATPPGPVPAPRCSALTTRDRPYHACNTSQLPVMCLCCRAYPVGSSLAEQVHCGPAWRRSALGDQCHVHLRHQRVVVERLLADVLRRTPCYVHPKTSPRRHQMQVPDEGRHLRCRSMLLESDSSFRCGTGYHYSSWSTGSNASPHSYVDYRHWLFHLLRRYKLSVLMWGQPWRWDRPCRPLLLQLHFPSRLQQARARKVPWWSRFPTTWPFRWRSRFARILERDADREHRCAYRTSDENLSCISIMCSVPSCPLQAVHFRPLITPVLGPMSDMPHDSDYEPWFPTNLLWSGGGPVMCQETSILSQSCPAAAGVRPRCLRLSMAVPLPMPCSCQVRQPLRSAIPGPCLGTSVTDAFRCHICIFSCDVTSPTVMLGRGALSQMPHEGFWSHLPPSPLFPPRKDSCHAPLAHAFGL